MKRLILFDIDGTLTRTQNGYLPFNEAMLETFGVPGDIRSVIPDGNTDPRIVEEIFAKAKIDIRILEAHWRQFINELRLSYSRAVHTGTIKIRTLPGAPELVRALSDNPIFIQAVVTGNFKATAQVKLEAAGLGAYFGLGAYGCDSPHRPDLPAIAKARWEQVSGESIGPEDCIVVGDTPKDLDAARHNGMKCVLVGTGRYPVEELKYYAPDAAVPDLADTEAISRLLLNL